MSFTAILLLSIGVALLGNILLLGLPGALFLQIASHLVKPLHWKGINELGDKAWPMAIVTTFLWGLGLIPCWLIEKRWHMWQPFGLWVLWLGWAILLSLGMLAYNHINSRNQ